MSVPKVVPGGNKGGLLGRKKGERPACLACARAMAGREKGDERILGSGDFVGRVLEEAEEFEEGRVRYKISIYELIKRVSEYIGIDIKDLMSSKRGRKNQLFQGYYQLSWSGEVGVHRDKNSVSAKVE